ncbi:hypothetical protein Tco_0831042 [Tanacetum coccineum]
MANQEQIPPQQEQPFVAAKQVSFNLEDIILNTNNEVALLYLEHNNQDYFKCVFYFISKCCLRKPFTRSSDMYKEYLAEFWNAISAHYLAHSSEYIAPPSIDIVRQWFLTIGYREKVSAKGTLRKSLLPPRWSLANGINIDYVNIFWEDIILKLKKKQREKQSSLKQPSVSSKEATKVGSSKAPTGSKTGHLKKRKESSSAMDSNPSQPPVSTSVDPGMHKEDQQATCGPTSLGVTSEARANPQLSSGMSAFNLNEPIYSASFIIYSESVSENDASAVSTTEVDPQNSAPSDFPSFKDLDLPEDDHVIIVESDAEEDDGIHDKTEDTLVPKSSFPKSSLIQELTNQLNELLVKSLKTKFFNILCAHDFSNSLPTKLKDLPSKFNRLIEEVKELKNQVHKLEIELPGDLKEIPTKLEDFTKTVTSLTSQVVKLKTLQWELLQKFVSLPGHVASVQAKLKTLDALPGLLSHIIKALNKFAHVLDSTSSKARDQSVPSGSQADTMPAEGEKNINQATISQLFQRRAKKVNLNRPQPETTTPLPIPPVITTTTSQMQSPSFLPPPKSSSQPKGEHIKEDKGKKALSLEEAEKESTKSGSDDEITHMPGSMKIKEEVKVEAARHEGEIRKEELLDLLGLEVVSKYYNDKLQYDKYCDKMMNRIAASKIPNCDVLTRNGPITLKVYKEDGTNEIIPNFKASDMYLGEWREVMEACLKRTRKG